MYHKEHTSASDISLYEFKLGAFCTASRRKITHDVLAAPELSLLLLLFPGYQDTFIKIYMLVSCENGKTNLFQI